VITQRTEQYPHPGFAHLSLEDLRTYRAALTDEETRVSYWRRILQARLDTIRARAASSEPERFAEVLTTERVNRGRLALTTIMPSDDVPPLPELGELWARLPLQRGDRPDTALEADLERADVELSVYRSGLHDRLRRATDELVSRYQRNPRLALTALPLGTGSAYGTFRQAR
jgi:hypothetical protein